MSEVETEEENLQRFRRLVPGLDSQNTAPVDPIVPSFQGERSIERIDLEEEPEWKPRPKKPRPRDGVVVEP